MRATGLLLHYWYVYIFQVDKYRTHFKTVLCYSYRIECRLFLFHTLITIQSSKTTNLDIYLRSCLIFIKHYQMVHIFLIRNIWCTDEFSTFHRTFSIQFIVWHSFFFFIVFPRNTILIDREGITWNLEIQNVLVSERFENIDANMYKFCFWFKTQPLKFILLYSFL